MKQINMTFDEADFNKLKRAKNRFGKKWEEFFLQMLKLWERIWGDKKMTELKTLKDIKMGRVGKTFETIRTEETIKKWIREEAIKWVKKIEGGASDGKDYSALFKKLFNITEEELKWHLQKIK